MARNNTNLTGSRVKFNCVSVDDNSTFNLLYKARNQKLNEQSFQSKSTKRFCRIFFFFLVSNIYFVKWMFKGFRQFSRINEFEKRASAIRWNGFQTYVSNPLHNVSSRMGEKNVNCHWKMSNNGHFATFTAFINTLMYTYKWSVIFLDRFKEWHFLCEPISSNNLNWLQKNGMSVTVVVWRIYGN